MKNQINRRRQLPHRIKNLTYQVFAVVFMVISLSLLTGTTSHAQILTPAKSQYAFQKTSDKEGILMIRVLIDEGWHIYGLKVPENGPERTVISLKPSKSYKAVGAVQEPEPLVKYEDAFKMNVPYHKGAVIFRQKVQLTDAQTTIRGTLRYQVCDDTSCLAAEDFDFAVKVE